MVDLGKIGDSSTLVWLYCDLQNWGKTLVRQGHREGLPLTGPRTWVFCPLLRKNFPRDRQLVEECQKCPHYKGVSHNLSKIGQQPQEVSWKPQMIKPKQKRNLPKKIVTEEDLKRAVEELKKENEEWEKEEKLIFKSGDKKNGRKETH